MKNRRRTDPLAIHGTRSALADSPILIVRETPVIPDTQLAELFGVTTKTLNQAVKRNAERFPNDFVPSLNPLELGPLRSQIVTSKGRGGRRYSTPAFTEHGAVMAATVLNSPRAVEISIYLLRAFVRMREYHGRDAENRRQLHELVSPVDGHDKSIAEIVASLRALMTKTTSPERRRIGYHTDTDAETEGIAEAPAPYRTRPRAPTRRTTSKIMNHPADHINKSPIHYLTRFIRTDRYLIDINGHEPNLYAAPVWFENGTTSDGATLSKLPRRRNRAAPAI